MTDSQKKFAILFLPDGGVLVLRVLEKNSTSKNEYCIIGIKKSRKSGGVSMVKHDTLLVCSPVWAHRQDLREVFNGTYNLLEASSIDQMLLLLQHLTL